MSFRGVMILFAFGALTALPASRSWAEPRDAIGFGVDSFGVATAEEVDISALVPIGGLFALRARSVVCFGWDEGTSVGGKLEGMFRSPVLANLIRVYAGFGPALFFGLTGPNAGQFDGNWLAGDIDGNWFAGAEVFFDPRVSLHWEFGTSGGALDAGAGPYADVGFEIYPF